jgi:acyl-CoA-binding protein
MHAFQVAQSEAQSLQKRASRQERLELYSLYQQATVGDNNTGM